MGRPFVGSLLERSVPRAGTAVTRNTDKKTPLFNICMNLPNASTHQRDATYHLASENASNIG